MGSPDRPVRGSDGGAMACGPGPGSAEPIWPAADFSRVPVAVFTDREVYEREQQRVFQGPVWLYLGLEAEIPEPGDYFTTFGGETPLVVNRAEDGSVRAFVNRCAHRGALVVRQRAGRGRSHTCAYHRWCFDLKGDLVGAPFRAGVDGKGGLDRGFDRAEHGLRKLAVACYRGVIFGSFADHPEPLDDYLGAAVRRTIDRAMHKPIEVLGHLRHRIDGNWKAYFENLTDSVHAGLLHRLPVRVGLWSNTEKGGVELDSLGRHSHYYVSYDEASVGEMAEHDGAAVLHGDRLKLCDTAFLESRDEWGDRISTDTLSIFPNVMFAQVANFLIFEQIRTKGPDEFELQTTVFGYADDDEEMRRLRQRQVAWLGPGGYVAIEDNEAAALVQQAARGQRRAHSYIGYGGTGRIGSSDHLISEVPIRGFWRYYCHLMGYRPAGQGAADPAAWETAEAILPMAGA